MTPDSQQTVVDPFGERSQGHHKRELQLLGGSFEFRSDSLELLALVDMAYRGLPAHVLPHGAPNFLIELRLTEGTGLAGLEQPPEPRMQGGAGFVCALMDAANLAIAFPDSRRGLVAISREMLGLFPYHARYELIEFLVFTLAGRAQGLVPLHAGCIGSKKGRGALLVGESGAGKSTLSLHCMLQEGLDFLTEDASFVAPQDLSVMGVGNFLHLCFDALDFLDEEMRAVATHSPVIRRRSGVEKYELDLRQPWARLAPAPLKLEHIVMVSAEPAASGPLLTPLSADELLARLTRSQPYAARQPGWPLFAERVSRLHGRHHQLRRGSHPREAAEALRGLLL